MTQEAPFNPLDKKNLGTSVAEALLKQKTGPLPPDESFHGAGIYAIYYLGGFPAYKHVSVMNAGRRLRAPIYVGKAIPKGGRKGIVDPEEKGKDVYKRLREHADSISTTSTLKLSDFRCQHLLVDDIWIPLAESLLIQRFKPVWNVVLDGFGNHTPGKGRFKGRCPSWDVVHPGRAWAKKCKPNGKTQEQLLAEVREFFKAEA